MTETKKYPNYKSHCKTSIYLPDEEMVRLKREARRRRVSRSKLIHEALTQLLGELDSDAR